MADIAVDKEEVGDLPHALVRDKTAGATGSRGDWVYIAADGDIELADGSAAGTARAFGIVVAIGGGKDDFVVGDVVTIVYLGPVKGYSGMTAGDVLFASDTAGKAADAAGTVAQKLGQAFDAEIIMVNPELGA